MAGLASSIAEQGHRSHRHCAVFGTYFSGFVFSGEKGKKEPGGGRLEELFHGAVDF